MEIQDVSSAISASSALSGDILSHYPQASPLGGFGVSSPVSGFVTGFSNGVNLGTATATLNVVPEPSGLLALGALMPALLFRRRR